MTLAACIEDRNISARHHRLVTATAAALLVLTACATYGAGPSSGSVTVPAGSEARPVRVPAPDAGPRVLATPSPTPFDPAVFAALNPVTAKQVIEDDQYPYHTKGTYGRDSIRPVYAPIFLTADEAHFDPEELVIGVSYNGDSRAYPVGMLRVREMVHDEVGGVPILVTW